MTQFPIRVPGFADAPDIARVDAVGLETTKHSRRRAGNGKRSSTNLGLLRRG